MNKKILIGSIIAVAILVLVTTTSAVNVNNSGDNHPPSTPIITGPEWGLLEVEYPFTFVSTDLDGDNISYLIDWDFDWEVTEFYGSGEKIIRNQTFPCYGTIVISARAQDTHGEVSDWGYWFILINYDREIITYIRGKVINFEVFDGFIIRDVDITGDNISINGWKYPYDNPYYCERFQECVNRISISQFLGFIHQSNQVLGIAFGDIEWS